MLPFTDTFKLYVRQPPQSHKLSIRITDQTCDTYLTNTAQLDWLCSSWHSTDGASLEHAGEWFVQHKHAGTPREYVRISVWHSSICRDYRVSSADMERLSAQWQQEKIIITATEEIQDAHS